MQKGNIKKAFTLVELIVVITILAILATIGFVSFSGYLAGTRDTNRIAQLKSMSDALELYRTKKDLPIPDDKVDIKSGSDVIAYQGYIGKNVLETIEYTESGLDPKDKTYFSYYLTKNKKYFQLLSFLEEPNTDVVAINNKRPVLGTKNIALKTGLRKVDATDYSERYPYTKGNKLGILTDENNTPIQEISAITGSGYLDISDVSTLDLKSYLNDHEIITGTGTNFSGLKKMAIYGGKGFSILGGYTLIHDDTELECPKGFIRVPGMSKFNTDPFCVAKYEMSYNETDGKDVGGSGWNTRKYYSSKIPVSMANRLPVTELNQTQAIEQCNKMGIGYHLITNNEWMTIARNLEAQGSNWSSGTAGNGGIYRGVVNESNYGCASGKTGDSNGNDTGDWAGITGADSSKCIGGRNKLKLSNGNYVYDLSGNVWEHVDRTNDPTRTTAGIGNGDLCGTSGYWYTDGDPSNTCRSDYGPILSNTKNGTDKGMGYVWNSSGTDKLFSRGASANHSINDGIFTLSSGMGVNSQGNNIGFRCSK